MATADDIETLRDNRHNLRFSHPVRICRRYLGTPRISGSHHIFKTPWKGDPRINLQKVRGKLKPYQVDQVINALQRMEFENAGLKEKAGIENAEEGRD